MQPLIKIPRPLLTRALSDLQRPHPFAYERLGFFSMRQSAHDQRPLILCYDYHSIPDEQYIPDSTCGARINQQAIQSAMGRAFRNRSGQLWVHTHGPSGQPEPSRTDRAEGPRVSQSVANAQPNAFHGWAIIAEDAVWAEIRIARDVTFVARDLAVVGWPLVIPRRTKPVLRSWRDLLLNKFKQDRYDRQSFLGIDAKRNFARAKVGIVGLGGGGSHIAQQLAHIGLHRVVLCDHDRIDWTNLNRLIGGTVWDVLRKRYKTKIASRTFRRLQPDAEIDDAPRSWEAKRDALRDCDIIFGCVDSFPNRRDLEAFCRAHMIPLIDIGMVVNQPEADYPQIHGQAVVSLPGEACMQCLQVLTAANLGRAAQDYNAGEQPQVVWPNGVLASTAVGLAVELLTGWSGAKPGSRIDYHGSEHTLAHSNLSRAMEELTCRHYPLDQVGDPIFGSI